METLSKRTQSLLMNAGIKSLQELSEYTAADLLKFRNFGYKSLQEVEPYLKTFDFTIKSDNTQTQIEKLQADKAELLEALEEVKRLEPIICMGGAVAEQWQNEAQVLNEMMSGIESLIQKHKQ